MTPSTLLVSPGVSEQRVAVDAQADIQESAFGAVLSGPSVDSPAGTNRDTLTATPLPNPRTPGRTERGTWAPGNQGGLRHGGYVERLNDEDLARLAAKQRELEDELGPFSHVQRDQARSYAFCDELLRRMETIIAGSVITERGRPRAIVTRYFDILDRRERLAKALRAIRSKSSRASPVDVFSTSPQP